jgi:hypothetical protein
MPTRADRPKVPKFDSEAEEAKWWDDNRDIAEGELLKAMRDGTVQRGASQMLLHEALNREESDTNAPPPKRKTG